jgi:hypothetical protein
MVALFMSGACGVEDPGIVNDENPLMSANGLTSNGLTSNGLTSNGLTSNGLTSNGLTSNGLTSNGLVMTALRDKTATGDLTRIFFRYLISCALPVGKSVTYTWVDAAGMNRTEINPGSLGLAPGWATAPASDADKRWVSACLGARTNALGVNVPMSMRAKGVAALAVTSSERTAYTYGEGAFWGNLFHSAGPYMYSCSRSALNYGSPTSVDSGSGRSCATVGCGMIRSIGACFKSDYASTGQACYERASNKDWVVNCSSSATKSAGIADSVIATWLRP